MDQHIALQQELLDRERAWALSAMLEQAAYDLTAFNLQNVHFRRLGNDVAVIARTRSARI